MKPLQKHNFGAGPCILPHTVMAQAASAVTDWNGSGLSILEVSHRSEEFGRVLSQARSLVAELLGVPQGYQILFLQGGASTQFGMLAQNLMAPGGRGTGAYLDSGFFALKAMAEAEHFGQVRVVGSSADRGYRYVPEVSLSLEGADYLHVTSNNTIEGTQLWEFPVFDGVPLVCDMSSDIFSRRINVADFGLIYAGAQKNLGPAGMTLVIVRKDLLEGISQRLPSMSDYRVQANAGSLYNTPPVFSIYVALLNMVWMREQGGVEEMARRGTEKSALLYQALEESTLFFPMAEAGHRSRMNVTFDAHEKVHVEGLLAHVAQRGIVGIQGYPSLGGFRASLYNALPRFSVEYLVTEIQRYEAAVLGRKPAGTLSLAGA